MTKVELFNDHFENAKSYQIPSAQLIIADIPYNLGKKAYASNPAWYNDGDNSNGESELAGKQFFDTDGDFKINNFFDFCTRYLKKEPKKGGERGKSSGAPAMIVMIVNWFNWQTDGVEVPKIHPTQKPVRMLKRLIEIFTDYGDVVIDPCAGSGSTLRAAAELGRNAYGFEIKKNFVKQAKAKMLANIQPDIFTVMYEAQQRERRQAFLNRQISLFTG